MRSGRLATSIRCKPLASGAVRTYALNRQVPPETGENREAGAEPARARRCDGDRTADATGAIREGAAPG